MQALQLQKANQQNKASPRKRRLRKHESGKMLQRKQMLQSKRTKGTMHGVTVPTGFCSSTQLQFEQHSLLRSSPILRHILLQMMATQLLRIH